MFKEPSAEYRHIFIGKPLYVLQAVDTNLCIVSTTDPVKKAYKFTNKLNRRN